MFTIKARLVIGGMLILLGYVFYRYQTYELVAVVALLMVALIVEYFRQGTLVLAAKQFHLKNYGGAEALLKEVKKPEWLSKKRRGFYEYMMGGISMHKPDFESAEYHYEQAAKYPLRTLNDHIAALVAVANISLRNGKPEKTVAYLQLANQHQDKQTAKMKAVIAEIQHNLKSYKTE
jgi:hypothetical protein